MPHHPGALAEVKLRLRAPQVAAGDHAWLPRVANLGSRYLSQLRPEYDIMNL